MQEFPIRAYNVCMNKGWFNINPMSKTQFVALMSAVAIILILCLTVIFPAIYQKQSPQNRMASQADIQLISLTPQGEKNKAKHPTWSREICNAIGNKEILAGMTIEQVIEAWGNPDNVNTTVTAKGKHHQWIYKERKVYVYTDDGIVTGWQE